MARRPDEIGTGVDPRERGLRLRPPCLEKPNRVVGTPAVLGLVGIRGTTITSSLAVAAVRVHGVPRSVAVMAVDV